MNRYLIVLAATIMLLSGAAIALADDFAPAPWRGQPMTLAAEWDFITPDLTDLPPDYTNTIGDGTHEWNDCYMHTHPQFVYWEEDPTDPEDGRAYTTDVPGQLLFFLCNWIDDFEYKYIWVQITFGGDGMPYVYEVVAPNQATNDWPDPVYGTPVENNSMTGRSVEFWVLPYNPDREYVNVEIPPYTWIDQIWIETISTRDIIATEQTTWGGIKSLYR